MVLREGGRRWMKSFRTETLTRERLHGVRQRDLAVGRPSGDDNGGGGGARLPGGRRDAAWGHHQAAVEGGSGGAW
jgi:hypothetical protein